MFDLITGMHSPWLTCFCVVAFDLELGQKLEHTFPPTSFTEEETMNICFSSFPDSPQLGDTTFEFRHRISTESKSTHFYGYVFFRQEKDQSIHRGYLQKSVVLISVHPFLALFKKVVSLAGPLFFEFGNPLLEAAFQNILAWPVPIPGKTFELPILGNVLTVHLPFSHTPHVIDPSASTVGIVGTNESTVSISPKQQLVSNLQCVSVYRSFGMLSEQLWLIWELALIGEPILILSHSPSFSSEAVLATISLISPLTYGGDFRPYFTIHDSDFNNLTQNIPKLPCVILGVTNPFFCKALEHWPHTLFIGDVLNQNTKSSRREKLASLSAKKTIPVKQELKTKYKALLKYDKQHILSQLSAAAESEEQNNSILRFHFFKLTESFLIPLERYFASLMPLAREISVFHKPPRLKVFDEEHFLRQIETSSKSFITGKKPSDGEVELYSRFIHSPNFKTWFNSRKKEALEKLHNLYSKTMFEADITLLLRDRKETERVDLYLRVREQLDVEIRKKGGPEGKMVNRLEEHLIAIVNCLPPDLQESILRQESSKQIFKIEDSDGEEETSGANEADKMDPKKPVVLESADGKQELDL